MALAARYPRRNRVYRLPRVNSVSIEKYESSAAHKGRCFCAADLTLHPQNQLLLAIRRYWRTCASGGFREDVNRRIAD
ncbi:MULTISPECIES: hypothetical protein [unclassified Microcoleus]|uniref:hypothetical protein n=1 Tax=unclassified Microcoleus TaxID=2642155 RepID=UPI002FD49386